MRSIKNNIIRILIDLILAALIVSGTYLYYFKIYHGTATTAVPTFTTMALRNSATATSFADAEALKAKFSNQFTDTIVSTADSYTSPNLSIHLQHYNIDSQQLDTTASGKHEKYGTRIAYTVADVYVSDLSCFRTVFAQDTYGVGYEEHISKMSKRIQAVLGVNGDSYSNNRHKNNGTIIRNGVLYRAQSTDVETCVLFQDGSMKILQPSEVDAEQLMQNGAWQSWIFGPSLLDENGNAKTEFLTWDYIRESHPRTAIGYYEPGHYCFVVVDGRQQGYSRGMFLEELSQLFANLGCKVAYNLDGGYSSSMVLQNNTVSQPYKPSRNISDGIFFTEGSI